MHYLLVVPEVNVYYGRGCQPSQGSKIRRPFELRGQEGRQVIKGEGADIYVSTDSFAAFVDSPLQWVFNKSSILGQNGAGGQYITISLSGAFEYINQPKEVLQQTFVEAMAQAFPKAKLAKVERILVVKQEKATFRCLPGSERLRPKAETPIENLFLAGEWTDTGWPSTMEGAVRSGVTAAQAVVNGSNR